jgi:hypothetical protein
MNHLDLYWELAALLWNETSKNTRLPSTTSTMGRADTKWREIEAFLGTLSTERVTCWCYKEHKMNRKQCYRTQD